MGEIKAMRRKDREISPDEAKELLVTCSYGILSSVGTDGQAYGVPLNYVYKDGAIYFHSALKGHKIENMEHNPLVSFCVVGETKTLAEEFATEYESVIAFGKAFEVVGEERKNALMWLLDKYSPQYKEEGKIYAQKKDRATKVFKIDIGIISGKARR